MGGREEPKSEHQFVACAEDFGISHATLITSSYMYEVVSVMICGSSIQTYDSRYV